MINFFRIRFWLIAFWLLGSLPLSAQLVGVPILPQAIKNNNKNARLQAINLPFFDDFSSVIDGTPNPTLWINGGTYVSNTITTNHPSINVVVFDGANALGIPYTLTNPNLQGITDTLTSQAINLQNLTVTDSVALSFFWQAQGLGELPDSEDSLYVQFLPKGNDAKWETVWKQSGGRTTKEFNYAKIILKDTRFMHDKFQFRFMALGRKSGQFDTWAIDYIYLNKNRVLQDKYVKDVAVYQDITPFLKRYNAMPLKQYLAKAAAETADSVVVSARTLDLGPNNITFTLHTYDKISGKEFLNIRQILRIPNFSSKSASFKNTLISVDTAQYKRLILINKFKLITTDNDNPATVGLDLQRNDSLDRATVLDNYYAYDDGTAEYAVYMNKTLGRTALRYALNTPDVVSGVRINIVPILKDLTGQGITIQIWSNKNAKPVSLIYQKTFKINYPQKRDSFIEFPFEYGIAVKDTFYIGWQQNGSDGIAIGLDKNTPRQDQIFVNLGTEWAPYTNFQNDPNLAFFKGSLMIRPIIGGKPEAPLTAVEPIKNFSEFILFPNPTSGKINWTDEGIYQIEVFSIAGIAVKNLVLNNNEKNIDLSDLTEGMYIIRFFDGKQTKTRKIILRK